MDPSREAHGHTGRRWETRRSLCVVRELPSVAGCARGRVEHRQPHRLARRGTLGQRRKGGGQRESDPRGVLRFGLGGCHGLRASDRTLRRQYLRRQQGCRQRGGNRDSEDLTCGIGIEAFLLVDAFARCLSRWVRSGPGHPGGELLELGGRHVSAREHTGAPGAMPRDHDAPVHCQGAQVCPVQAPNRCPGLR